MSGKTKKTAAKAKPGGGNAGKKPTGPNKQSSSAMAVEAAKEEKRRKREEAESKPAGPGTLEKIRGRAARSIVESSTGKWALDVVEQQGEAGVEIAEGVRDAAERQKMYIESLRTKEELEATALLKLQSRFNHGLPISDLGSGELQDAVRLKNNNHVVKMLTHERADPDQIDKRTGYTALMVAAKNSNKWAAQVLLDAGADVRYQSRRGMTALAFAAKLGESGIARIILERAYECRHVRALLELRDTDGRTARDHALGRGQSQLVAKMESVLREEQRVKRVEDMLLHIEDHAEEIYSSHGFPNGSTALHWLLEHGSAQFFSGENRNRAVRVIKRLVNLGADYNDKDAGERVPLHYAAMSDGAPNTSCAKALVRAVADLDPEHEGLAAPLEVDAADMSGMTPLMYAIERGDADFCEVLRRCGADIHQIHTSSMFTLLHFAAQRNFGEGADEFAGEAAQWLVDNEVDISLKDSYGRTALEVAVEAGGRQSRFVKVMDKFKEELRQRKYRVKAIMAGQGLS